MITFLPYADFKRSAQCLDYRRLGKQRIEARQLVFSLTDPGSPHRLSPEGVPLIRFNDAAARPGWRHHPAAAMWAGFVPALLNYGDAMIFEWIARGYNNSMPMSGVTAFDPPPWLGDAQLHDSHQARLLGKLPDFYVQYGWGVAPSNDPYHWPSRG
jgi:hypothetical protein